MLDFDQNGFLKPYGPIPADLDQLELVFVEEFTTSTTRRGHFERFREYNTRLRAYLPDEFLQWVDGSFVSRKTNPNDLDVLTFVPTAIYGPNERAFKELKEEFKKGTGGRVDAHVIQVYAENHRYRVRYESDYIEWLHIWGYTSTRPRNPKGFVELKTV